MHLVDKELSGQIANLLRHGIAILETTSLIGQVALHDTYEFLSGHFHVRLTDTVAYMLDGNSLAVRRVEGLEHVVQESGLWVMESIELEHHMLSQTSCSGADATR